MGYTDYPNGVTSFGLPIIPAVTPNVTTGNIFFVNSATGNNSADQGKSPSTPFDSLDYAIGKCTASNGDVIYLMPGHTDTVSAAGTITMDVAGISVIGLGNGLLRPTITFNTAAAATITWSAANCSIENVIFNANFADIVAAITVSGKDAVIKNCLFKEQATNMNFLSLIVTDAVDNSSDGLSVIACERISIDAAALAFVSILGNCNRLKLICNFDNQSSAADVGHFVIMSSKVCLGAQIIGNVLNLNGDNNAQTVGVFATGSSTTSTGVMAYNLVGSLDTTTELIVTAGLDFQQFQNFYTGTIAASGKLWPAVDGA